MSYASTRRVRRRRRARLEETPRRLKKAPVSVKILSRPGFDSHPGVRKMYELLGDLLVEINGHVLRIPKGFRFDGSSVPRLLRWIVDSDDLGHLAPAVHDYLFRFGGYFYCDRTGELVRLGRFESDRVYLKVAKQDGAIPWRRRVAYAGLFVGSWTQWKNIGNPHVETN